MDIPSVVREMQRITGENQSELGRRLGVSQPTVSRWLSGASPELPQYDRIISTALELGVIRDKSDVDAPTIEIIGYVGAGGSVIFGEGQGPFGEAEMPPVAGTGRMVAVKVRGTSMSGKLEDGWLVYYNDRRDPPTDDLLNKLCVVGLEDGRVLIKNLGKRDADGKFVLYSVNEPPLFDQSISWAARVAFIAPQ